MNSLWHFFFSHSIEFLFFLLALGIHLFKEARRKAAKDKAEPPLQSEPTAPTMAPQQLTNTTKNDSSPWSNADPFNS